MIAVICRRRSARRCARARHRAYDDRKFPRAPRVPPARSASTNSSESVSPSAPAAARARDSALVRPLEQRDMAQVRDRRRIGPGPRRRACARSLARSASSPAPVSCRHGRNHAWPVSLRDSALFETINSLIISSFARVSPRLIGIERQRSVDDHQDEVGDVLRPASPAHAFGFNRMSASAACLPCRQASRAVRRDP